MNVQETFHLNFPKKRIIHGGQFTKAFIKFNQKLVRAGATDNVVYTNKQGNPMVYNKSTDRFVQKSTYYTKAGKLRSKFNNPNYVIDNDTLLDPRVYVNKTFLPQFNKALKTNATVNIPINFPAINDDIRFLLPKLKTQEGKVILLESNGVYFALNHTNIKRLRKALQPGVILETVWESGQEILTAITENPNPQIIVRNRIGDYIIDGSFFDKTHTLPKVNLDKYGVFHKIDKKNYDNNCLCECFKAAGHDITGIKHMVRNQAIPQRLLGAVAKQLDVYITVRRIEDKSNLRHYGDKTKPRLELGLINKHYFLIEKTEYTSYCIKNYFEVEGKDRWNEIYKKSAKQTFRGKDRFISSYDVIRLLLERKETHLKEIELCDELYKVIEYKKVDEVFTDLSYNDDVQGFELGPDGMEYRDGGLKKNEYRDPKKFKKDCTETYYFDFETTTRRNDTNDTIHKPYCVYTDLHRDGFFGEDCGKQLLKDIILHHGLSIEALQDLEDHNCNPETKKKDKIPIPFVRMIAHNSGYDFRFILKYLSRVDTIEKGTGLMTATARFYYGDRVVCIEIKDSLKMINMPLAKFSGAFNLDVKKEIMPYDLYTEENVEEVWIDKKVCLSFVKKEDQEEYLVNCEKWNCIEDDKINILDYAGEYCYMDCITLKEGYEKFGVLVQQAIKEDINDYISLASMAHNYMVREGCYKGVLAMAGVPRAFIQKCVVGGRTMCCENKKSISGERFDKYSHKKISDFDAVSLYPSAMARMPGFLKGKPKIITDWDHCKEYADGYFVCVRVKSITKTYKFPCVSLMTDNGIRNFTNDLVGEVLYLDKVGMEDFVSYHGAEVEFINGYYYNKGHNNKICSVIQYLFEQRLKFKKQKNPIQMVFKELMNSSYGKSYLKPIDSDSHYIPEKEFDKFMDRNYNYIQEAVKLANGKYYKVKVLKPIDQHFNNVHVGVEILSMSKRIMFEVMTLAEDLDISMYYTDTDSIHIDSDKIELLGQEFHKKYGRELIGNQMGQFHTDFDMDGAVGDIHAVESIFLGKKCYIDKLEAEDKEGNKIYDYHIRMKGVPSDCIKYKADQEYNGDIVALYKDLYDGKELTFNLLAVRPKFELCKNMTIISRKSFNRNIRF